MQADRSYFPSSDRVGILTASVLLTFALTRLIESPRLTLTLSLPGFYFAFPLTLGVFMTLFAAALAAAGMDWLTRTHPGLGNKSPREHLMLPALTTLVMGAALMLFTENSAWWAGFALGAILLVSVYLAEYITINPSAPSYALARSGLTALAYALFFILAASLRIAGARMFLLAPSIFLVAGFISLRILHLDGADRWDFPWAVGIGIVCAQISAGLHYWALSPIQFGLALIGPLYALTMLSVSLADHIPMRRAIVGPALVLGAAWLSALFFS